MLSGMGVRQEGGEGLGVADSVGPRGSRGGDQRWRYVGGRRIVVLDCCCSCRHRSSLRCRCCPPCPLQCALQASRDAASRHCWLNDHLQGKRRGMISNKPKLPPGPREIRHRHRREDCCSRAVTCISANAGLASPLGSSWDESNRASGSQKWHWIARWHMHKWKCFRTRRDTSPFLSP